MRTKKEIMKGADNDLLLEKEYFLEVLVDIRDVLNELQKKVRK